MRVLITAAAWFASVAALAPVIAALLLVLAGPHASVLPAALEGPARWGGLACLLVVPALVARLAWRRASRRRAAA